MQKNNTLEITITCDYDHVK